MSNVTECGGAKVLWKATSTTSQGFGRAGKRRISGLAICQYPATLHEVYLFACDRHWNVIGDLVYSSVEAAKVDAERFYEVTSIAWYPAT